MLAHDDVVGDADQVDARLLRAPSELRHRRERVADEHRSEADARERQATEAEQRARIAQREAEADWERWQVRMIARCIVAPKFLKDPEAIDKLGSDGKLLVKNSATFTFTGVSGFTEDDIAERFAFGLGTAPDSFLAPEPSSVWLAIVGVVGVAALARRCQELGLAVPLADAPGARVEPRRLRSALRRLARERSAFAAGLAAARSWELRTMDGRRAILDRLLVLANSDVHRVAGRESDGLAVGMDQRRTRASDVTPAAPTTTSPARRKMGR